MGGSPVLLRAKASSRPAAQVPPSRMRASGICGPPRVRRGRGRGRRRGERGGWRRGAADLALGDPKAVPNPLRRLVDEADREPAPLDDQLVRDVVPARQHLDVPRLQHARV
jgi:hypothetical protein